MKIRDYHFPPIPFLFKLLLIGTSLMIASLDFYNGVIYAFSFQSARIFLAVGYKKRIFNETHVLDGIFLWTAIFNAILNLIF